MYEYGPENKLISAKLVEKIGTDLAIKRTVNLRYDGLGRRIEKEIIESDGSIKRKNYVYDRGNILLEFDKDSVLTAKHITTGGIDDQLFVVRGGEAYFLHKDLVGSVHTITDRVGKVIQKNKYSSFGEIEEIEDGSGNVLDFDLANKPVDIPYYFTGREFDNELGYYYYRARYYDSQSGRFMSKDPIGLEGQDTNLYRYVFNNPINFTDPLGLRTDGIGLSLSGNAFGLGFTVEGSFVTDDKGGRGFALSGGVGSVAAGIGGSLTFQTQHTNAPTIADLEGVGSQSGLSVFVSPTLVGIGGGSEVITSGEFVGGTTNFGVGTTGGSFSVIPTATTIFQTTPSRPVKCGGN